MNATILCTSYQEDLALNMETGIVTCSATGDRSSVYISSAMAQSKAIERSSSLLHINGSASTLAWGEIKTKSILKKT